MTRTKGNEYGLGHETFSLGENDGTFSTMVYFSRTLVLLYYITVVSDLCPLF